MTFLKVISVNLFFIYMVACAIAQEPKKNEEIGIKKIPKIILKIDLIRPLIEEIPISIEFISQKGNALELKAGIIYSNPFLKDFIEGAYGSNRFYYAGTIFQAGYRRYFDGSQGSYFQFSIGYVNKSFENENLWLGGWGGSSSADEFILSETVNQIMIIPKIGQRFTTGRLCLDAYIGIGGKVSYKKTTYHWSRQEIDNEFLNTPYYSQQFRPSLRLGVQIGGLLCK